MNEIAAWFAMGHYGVYVWCTYGLVSVVLIAGVFHAHRLQARTWRSLRRWFSRSM